MDYFKTLLGFFLHVDKYLLPIVAQSGLAAYGFLFLIIFLETGVVVAPFLPGDSLLFAAGAFAAQGVLNVVFLFLTVAAAAVLGDTVNYHVGYYLGNYWLTRSSGRFIKKEHLEKTHAFYERYGSKTIVLARFVPIVRTLAPFVAGVGRMKYFSFLAYNVLGAALWTTIFVLGGYFFGNLPLVQKNFTILILLIVAVSVLPGLVGYWRHKNKADTKLLL